MIASANTYLDALLSHDGSKIRLAPNARRTENGGVTGEGAADIRKSVSPPTPDQVNTGIRDKRWFVDGNQAVVLYLLDTSTLPPTILHTTTTHIAERFKVVRGLITQIEAIFWIAPGPTPEGSLWPKPAGEQPDQPLPAVTPAQVQGSSKGWCRDGGRTCVIASARTYVESIATRDYRQTRLATNVRRTQNAGLTASDAVGVRRNGQDPHPDAFITDMRQIRWFVDGSQAIAFSNADVGIGVHMATIHLVHRIKIVKGLMTEIESIYWIALGPTPESSGW